MTKEQIKQEALKREREVGPPASCSDPAYRGVNSAYGLGFVDGAEWAFRHKDKCLPFITVSNMNMINYKLTERDFWRQIIAEQIQAASDEYIADPSKGYHDPVLMAEPYWLSEAKPGDVFYFKDNDGRDVWQQCTVKECVHDVVFYTSIPIDKPELADLYAGLQHMEIGARANQHAFLHRAEVHIAKDDLSQYRSLCPYTKIVKDE